MVLIGLFVMLSSLVAASVARLLACLGPAGSRVKILWLCALCGACLQLQSSWAQGLTREQLTASYLYNFARNIEWPNEANLTRFRLGVLGGDARLLAELRSMAEQVKVRGLPMEVENLDADGKLNRYQLIYLAAVASADLTEIYERLDSRPVLLVSSDLPNKQLVMINLLSTSEGRLKFEVNKSNLINHGLQPLPELILNGGTEIDVAKLYREGQASLVAMQKQLQTRENVLDQLSRTIDSQEARNQQLQQQMQSLQQNINDSDQTIAHQTAELSAQKTQMENSARERERLQQEVDARTLELNRQQQQLRSITSQIDEREQRLTALNQTLATQEHEIDAQKLAIAGLDQQVDAQKVSLRYLRALMVVAALLIATILVAYSMKRRANERLAARGKDLQIARDRLAIAKRKAEDASQAKSEFLSLMSHELRTPLQSIIGYTELVIEDLKLEQQSRYVADLTRVITNGERLLKLINGVLDLAKIEAGRMDLDLTEVRLSSLVDEAVDAIGGLLEKSRVTITREVDDGVCLPLADPEKLLHIMINLLGNACKFAQDGQVEIKALHRDEKIYLSVADTGIGMSVEQQAHIFDPFRQADSSTTRKYQGSGLGLSITRQLCELMGGQISLVSELGQGSCFTLEIPLPIKTKASKPAEAASTSPQIALEGDAFVEDFSAQLVIVEPELVLMEQLARGLQGKPVQLHSASDALSGLQLIKELKPGAIILDMLLPNQQAWVLLQKLRAQPELAAIPVLAVGVMAGGALVRVAQGELEPLVRDSLQQLVTGLARID